MITQIGECQAIYNRKITVRERSFSENDEEINLKKYIFFVKKVKKLQRKEPTFLNSLKLQNNLGDR